MKMKKLILCLLVLASISTVIIGQDLNDFVQLQQKYPELAKFYADELQNVKAEYIVAIDLSSSMNKKPTGAVTSYFEQVKTGLIQFVNAIPDSSKVSIIGFGTDVRAIQLPTVVNASSRSKINATISDLNANEGYTDLKGAISYLIESCSSTSEIKYLFIFTDFDNDPIGSSPYNKVTWDNLADNYSKIKQFSMIETFALKLPLFNNSGRELPDVRKVFLGMNVIEFDANTLQFWFADRSSKIMEQNLWSFVKRDLKDVHDNKLLQLSATISLNTVVEIKAVLDSLPEYINGIKLTEINKLKTVPASEFNLNVTEIKKDKPKSSIGKIKFDKASNPIIRNVELNALVQGVFITKAYQEIEKLYAVVSLKQGEADNVDEVSAEDLLNYQQNIRAESNIVIAWPLWLFFLVIAIILLVVVLLVINTILPRKLKNYIVRINDSEPINMGSKKVFEISNSNAANYNLSTTDKLEIKIFVSRADPFCLIIKHRLCFKVKANSSSVVFDNSIQKNKSVYKLPLLKNIMVSENLSNVKLFFYKGEKAKR
jgi:hypothetical protein